MRRLVLLVGLLVVFGISGSAFAEDGASGGNGRVSPPVFTDGEVLGSNNWKKAEGFLPEEILKHYRLGEYRNAYVDLEKDGRRSLEMPPDFREATEKNRGRFRLSPGGAVVDASTGEHPRFIMGFPFPGISPDDPDAGRKVVWNYFYNNWYTNADAHYVTEIMMLNRKGLERSVLTDVKILTYDGTSDAKDRPNPRKLLQQISAVMLRPADLEGMVSLTWRYRDPKKRDSLWTYVPQLRRVRQVSPLNRSDGFMGSDLSMDDGAFFDGKPEDFTFRLLGRERQLVLVDPFSVRGEAEIIPVKGGGWRIVWKDVPRIGVDDPNWKGLPWAPVTAALSLRDVWVVEARPKDPNYLYGRIILRFDAENYHGTWSSKYDQADQLMVSYQVSQGVYFSPDGGKTYVSAGGIVIQVAENVLYGRATASLFPRRNPNNPADTHVPFRPSEFSIESLMQLGK